MKANKVTLTLEAQALQHEWMMSLTSEQIEEIKQYQQEFHKPPEWMLTALREINEKQALLPNGGLCYGEPEEYKLKKDDRGTK